jgi:hypothetical protein
MRERWNEKIRGMRTTARNSKPRSGGRPPFGVDLRARRRKRRSPVRAALESESDLAPSSPSAALLSDLRARVAEAVAASAPEQIKELLAAVVSRIVVESRASIQPYFVAPAVRTLLPSRRRTGIEPA